LSEHIGGGVVQKVSRQPDGGHMENTEIGSASIYWGSDRLKGNPHSDGDRTPGHGDKGEAKRSNNNNKIINVFV